MGKVKVFGTTFEALEQQISRIKKERTVVSVKYAPSVKGFKAVVTTK